MLVAARAYVGEPAWWEGRCQNATHVGQQGILPACRCILSLPSANHSLWLRPKAEFFLTCFGPCASGRTWRLCIWPHLAPVHPGASGGILCMVRWGTFGFEGLHRLMPLHVQAPVLGSGSGTGSCTGSGTGSCNSTRGPYIEALNLKGLDHDKLIALHRGFPISWLSLHAGEAPWSGAPTGATHIWMCLPSLPIMLGCSAL